jgi:hypothetical protein
MKPLPIALLLFVISFHSFAQVTYSPGYIVKINGDTTHGFLQEEIRTDLLSSVRFKTVSNGPIEILDGSVIKAFKYESGGLYKSITFINTLGDSSTLQTSFALQLVTGVYDLYSFLKDEQTLYIVTGNGFSYLLYNTQYNIDGSLKQEGNFVSRLAVVGRSCTKANLNAEQVAYNEKALANFIFELNNCVSPNSSSANYYQKPKAMMQATVFAGGIIMGKNKNQITLDAAARFNYPQLSKNVYINIGAHYTQTTRDDTEKEFGSNIVLDVIKDKIFCIPVTIQYNFTKGIIQPFVYGGFSAAYLKEGVTYSAYASPSGEPPPSKFGIGAIGSIGVEGHLNPNLYIKAEWRYELVAQHPVIGIAYSF